MRRSSAVIGHRKFTTREIEAVQRLAFSAVTTTSSLTPSPLVDWNRTLIQIVGFYNGFGGGVDNDVPDQSFYLDVNGNDLRFNRGSASTGGTSVWVDLITIRPGLIKKIHRGTLDMNSVGNATAALASKLVPSKSEPRWLGSYTNSAFGTAWPGYVEILDEATVKAIRGTSDSQTILSYEIVERN